MMMRFRTLYEFQGDPFANQLSFAAGTELIVPDAKKHLNQNGWSFGHYAHDASRRGWFPASFVTPIAVNEQPPAATASLGAGHYNNTGPISPTSVVPRPVVARSHGGTNSGSGKVTSGKLLVENDDDDEGFGGAIMGGEWNSSGTGLSTGSSAFGSSANSTARDNSSVSSPRSSRRLPRMQNLGAAISGAAGRTGSSISQAASRTGTAISNAASKTSAATKKAVHEAGHRYRDMEDQRQQELDRNATTTTISTTSAQAGGSHHQVTTSHQRTVASSGGILPGKRTDQVTTTESSPHGWGGGSKTTVTTTSRRSGGFFPGIPGKTTTTQTVTRNSMGATTSVETQTQSRGGFYIIPMGPIGLAAAGALAAKHALDSRNDKNNQPNSSSN